MGKNYYGNRKSRVSINLNKLNISLGSIKIIEKVVEKLLEDEAKDLMKEERIDFNIDLNTGSKSFTAYTMDLTKKYIEINSDYRS